ncbi:MAG: SGNH/GDSL hydrolase family protein [Chthoniobacteraceae bacterium]
MKIPCSLRSLIAATSLLTLASPMRAAEPVLKLKDNDVWVMSGDSITAQRQHTNYIEAFYQTRFPTLNLHFRNSGIGGNRTGHILARFDYDIAAWKPTIVSVELGMNDVSAGDDPAAYIKGMREIIAKIRAIPAQPVLISSSPVDDGSRMNDWKSDRCRRIHPYTEALKALAAEEKIVFVDQYHPLVNLWGDNRAKGEAEARKKGTWPPKPTPAPVTPPAPADPKAKPAKPAEPPIAPSLIPLGGNPVHPGPVGQYTMAATILKSLGAEHEVSSATLKADGSVVSAKHCKITDASAKGGKLTFTRLDESSPWPILPEAKDAVRVLPAVLDLSRCMLQVNGLAAGKYRVSINGKPAATLDAKELAAGWNITSSFEGAVAERSVKILAAISNLQGKLNTEWRAASKDKNAEKLAEAQKAIDAADAEVHAACAPVAWHFEIEKDAK